MYHDEDEDDDDADVDVAADDYNNIGNDYYDNIYHESELL